MVDVTLRNNLSRALTWTELDGNFSALKAAIEGIVIGPFDASATTYTPSGTDAIATTVSDELDRHIVSILRFMSEVQRNDYLGRVGSLDLHAPIQKVLDYAMTNGLSVDAVPGIGLISDTLTISSPNTYFWGRGFNSVIRRSGDFGDTFLFTGNDATGALVDSCGIGNISIEAIGLMTSGAHVHANGCSLFQMRNISLLNGFYNAQFSGVARGYCSGVDALVSNIYGGAATGRCCWLFDLAGVNYGHRSSTDVMVDKFDVQASSVSPILIDHCIRTTGGDGIWLKNGHTRGGGVADIELDAAEADSQIGSFQMSGVHVDSIAAGGVGLHFKGNTNQIFNCKFSDMVLHGGAGGLHGILVDADTDVDGLDITDVNAFQFDREGVKLLGGRNYRFNNMNSRGNSRETTGSFSGIYMENVAGCNFDAGGSGRDEPGPVETLSQKYGLEIGSGCSDITGSIDLDGNLSASLGGSGAGVYRWNGGLLEKTPATLEASNLIPYGGIHFSGGAYLDGNALTGIADSKKFTLVMQVHFDNASTGTEVILDSTSSGNVIARNSTGNIVITMQNAAAATILQQTASGAQCAAAGTYTIMVSADMDDASSVRIYVNDVQNTVTSNTFTVGETIDFTVAEWSMGATVVGASPFTGDVYMAWLADGVYTDFNTVANRRLWATKGGVLQDLGAKGEKPTGSQPRMFHCYDDFEEWVFPRGSATTAWTINGTPAVVTTEDYTYDKNLLHAVTTTAAAHKVGRFVQTLTANRAGGTTTLDLTYVAAQSEPGRQITIRTTQAQTVVSGASDVVPIAGGAASTAILAATAGKFAVIELNADNATWTIIQAN